MQALMTQKRLPAHLPPSHLVLVLVLVQVQVLVQLLVAVVL